MAVSPVDDSIAKGLTLQYTAIGTYTDASTQDITDSVTWSSTDTGVATISNIVGSEGLAAAQAVGATKITATSSAISDTTNLTITAPELVSIAVTPVNDSIAKGLTLQYTAIGTYTDASTKDITGSVTWTSLDTSIGTISNTAGFEGLATAQNIGTTVITAAIDTISDSTNFTVTAPELVLIAVTPVDDSVAMGLTLQYTALGTYTDASTVDITDSVTWTSSNTGIATISNASDSEGLATGQNIGTVTITAASGAISESANFTVTAPALVTIAVTPVDDSIAKGLTLQYTAVGTYTDASTKDITDLVTWTSSDAGIAAISNTAGSEGFTIAQNMGTVVITATSDAISGSTNLTVTAPELVSIAVSPIDDSIAKGLTLQYAAIGTYTDASILDITDSVTWASTNTDVASISNAAGSEGLVTAQAIGATKITATSGAISDTTNLTVTVPALVSIVVTPVNDSIAKGLTLQFTATGTYSDASTLDITDSVIWSSTISSVATISNAAGSEGLASAQNIGTAIITAKDGAVSDSTNFTVTVPELVSIAVTPIDDSIASGLTLQYTSIGTYTDASTVDITDSVTWSSSNTGVATISNSAGSEGLTTAQNIGTAVITATSGSVSDSTNLTVLAPALVSIVVTPVDDSIAKGLTLQYTAIGTYTDASTLDITDTVTWSSTNTGIATISNAAGSEGLVDALAIGATKITATSGAISDTTNLTVTVPVLVLITVTPANSSVADGNSLQYTATGTYSDSSTANITGSVSWNSSNAGVATINGSGLATGQNTGSTTITATMGAISGNTGLTVAAALLESIAITPVNSSVADGNSLQYTAIGTYSNSSTANITGSVTWISTNTGIATINGSGLATGQSVGGTKITATLGVISDTTDLTVTAAVLESIAVTPANSSVADGNSLQYTATGTYSNSTTANITVSVSWTSSNTGVATINGSGLATGQNTGSTTITATLGAVSGNTGLTVTGIVLESITVTPVNSSVADGNSLQYTATGTYSDSSTANITGSVTWTSTNTGVATINGSGLATGQNTGSTTITATQGAILGNTGLTVSAPVLESIAITPADSAVSNGNSLQYTAIGTYSDSSTANITASVTWASTNTGVATINGSGLAAGQSVGGTKITATLGAISDTTDLTVTTAVLESITVTPANSSVADGNTVLYTAIGTYSDSSTMDISGLVSWNSSNTGVATINGSGLATGQNSGSTTITATLGAILGNTGLTVTGVVLESITVTPVDSSIADGNSLQYTATGTYSDSSTANITGSVIWTSTNTGVATINGLGLATGQSAGGTKITATQGAISDTTDLTVTTAVLESITVTPANSSVSSGNTLQYTATGTYSNSSTANITGSVTWTSSNTGVATINGSGLATGQSNGSTAITATLGAISGNTGLSVTSAVLESITVTPANNSVADGNTLQYIATGSYSDSSTANITGSVSWNSSNTGVATINGSGLATGQNTGSTTITATQGAILGNTGLTITVPVLVSIAVTPVDSAVSNGNSLQYTATGTYSNSSTVNITGSVTWTSTNTGVATINGSGLATGQSAGGTKITATLGAISDTTDLTVTTAVLESITVTPANSSVADGNTVLYTAIGTYSDSSTMDISGLVSWNSSNTGVATINGSGLATGQNSGSTTITATLGAILGNTGLTVTGVVLESITVTPVDSSIADGNSLQYTATGTYSDSSTANITGSVIWTSTNTGVATINGLGLATGQSAGGTKITATQGAISDTTDLTVTTAVLESITVTPANSSVSSGNTLQYTATGTYSNSSTANITGSVTWTSSNTGVATINGSGLATGQSNGSTTITATLGAISGNTGLSVTSAVLESITVTPANNSVADGNTLQYIATGSYSDSSTANITGSVSWNSSNTGVATINGSGLATGQNTGSTTITATQGAILGNTGLTITVPVLVSIAVTPANSSVPDGNTIQYTATGTYSNSSTVNITGSVTWSSTNTGVAIINGSGLATGQSLGGTKITATLGAISDTTDITVTAPVLVSITVTPDNSSVEVGNSLQYTATGTYSDSSTANITDLVTWLSTVPEFVTIDDSGLATGLQSGGGTIIRATLGSITDITFLSVTAPVLVSITVTPINNSVADGNSLQYTATGTYSDSSTVNITGSVAWTSSNNGVATINSSGIANRTESRVNNDYSDVWSNLGKYRAHSNRSCGCINISNTCQRFCARRQDFTVYSKRYLLRFINSKYNRLSGMDFFEYCSSNNKWFWTCNRAIAGRN